MAGRQNAGLEIHVQRRDAEDIQEGDNPENDVERVGVEDRLVLEDVGDQGDI
ncbi:hypothetical protein D3C72_2539490 [compost metagenome]